MNKGLNGHIAMLSTQIICGLNVPVGKSLLAEWMTPIGLASSRVLFATLIFWTIGLVFRREKVNAKDLMVIALGGISGVACTYLSFAWGLNYTTPVHFALIVALNPIVVMLFSVLFLKEAINRRKLTGVLLGIAGAWVLISQMDIAASYTWHCFRHRQYSYARILSDYHPKSGDKILSCHTSKMDVPICSIVHAAVQYK